MTRNTGPPPAWNATIPAGPFSGALTRACTGPSPGSRHHPEPSSPRRTQPGSSPACSTPNSPPARTCHHQPAQGGITMPDTSPDDAANLTALLYDYGGLWQIAKTPQGYRAQRRPVTASPAVLTAESVPALRGLLEHGYDTGKLAVLMRDFAQWEIERLDPGSAWVAVSRDSSHTHVITASDLDTLRTSLGRAAS